MTKITNISRLMLLLCALILALIFTLDIVGLVSDKNLVDFLLPKNWERIMTSPHAEQFAQAIWSPGARFLRFIGSILGNIYLYVSLFSLIKVFQSYSRGNIFTTQNAKRYKLIGLIFILDALLFRILSNTLIVLAATINNPQGNRTISIGISDLNVYQLVMAFIVVVISWVMYEGARLQKEQQYIV